MAARPDEEESAWVEGPVGVVGYVAQLNDTPRKKKKHPIGFRLPEKKT